MAKTIRRLSPGIYASQYSVRAVVSTAAGRKEKRFPFDTPLADIKRWRNEVRVKLEKKFPRPKAVGRHTFAADVGRHIKHLTIASWKSRRSELRAWQAVLPHGIRRNRITTDHAKKAVKIWHQGDVTPKTILNRVRALTAMYHDLDGPDAWTPADGVALPPVVKRLPDYVSPDRIKAVERTLFAQEAAGQIGPEWRARYMVLTACGARPVHVGRTVLADIDLERRVWRVTGAKGGEPILYALNEDQVAAWARFLEVGVFGEWDATKYARIVRAAGWPATIKPYAAKHSVGQDLIDAGVSRETIADLYGHTDAKTTRIYTPTSNLRKASQAIEGRLGYGQAPARSRFEAMSDAELRGLVEEIRLVVKARAPKKVARRVGRSQKRTVLRDVSRDRRRGASGS